MSRPDPKKAGHRSRLRAKFLKTGIGSLHDYEVIELLLTLATPMKDCKPQAKAALEKFKTLKKVLEASTEDLIKIYGIGRKNVFGIKLFQAIAERYLKENISKEELQSLKTPKSVYDYLFQSMQKEKKEIFKVLFLDSANKVIDISEIFRGTVDQAVIYPREVIKSALDNSATRLIFAHNHPSGNPKPSEHDIEITKKLKNSCDSVDIEILDHIIIGDGRYYSFRENGLL